MHRRACIDVHAYTYTQVYALKGHLEARLSAANMTLKLGEVCGGGRARVPRRGNDEIGKQRTEILGAAGSGFAFIVHDYQVLSADKLTIEQNHDSMGIAHEPGVYRDVSWGERQRGLWEVYAGWEDRHLLIISKAPDMLVTERYMVKGNRLDVAVKIQADDAERVLRRVYNRRSLSAR